MKRRYKYSPTFFKQVVTSKVRKNFSAVHFFFCIPLLFLFAAIKCSLPTDVEPVIWKIDMSIPFMKEQFKFNDRLKELNSGGMVVDTTQIITYRYQDTSVFTEDVGKHINFKGFHYTQKVGPIKFKRFDPVEAFSPYPFSGKVNADRAFRVDLSILVKDILTCVFDETSSPVKVVLSNTSSLSSKGVRLIIRNADDSVLDSANVGVIDAKGNKVISFTLAGKKMSPPLTGIVYGTLVGSPTANIGAGDGIKLAFQCDSIRASEAQVIDSCLLLSGSSIDLCNISDSIRLDYFDSETLRLQYVIKNTGGINVGITGSFLNVWDRTFATGRKLSTLTDLEKNLTSDDSLRYCRSKIINDTLEKGSMNGEALFSSVRVFPNSRAASSSALLYCRYDYKIIPKGKLVTISKTDSLDCSVVPVHSAYSGFEGVTRWPLSQTRMTDIVEIVYPWSNDVIASMKGKIRFTSCSSSIAMLMLPPDSNYMDSMQVLYTIFDPQNPADSICYLNKAVGVTPAKTIPASIGLSAFLSRFPVSMAIRLSTVLPGSTLLRLYNSPYSFTPDVNQFPCRFQTIVKHAFSLQGSATDTIAMVLSPYWMPVDNHKLAFIKKVKQLRLQNEYTVNNTSRSIFSLFGLAASKKYAKELLALPDSLIKESILKTSKGENFFSLLGNSHILVPDSGIAAKQLSLYDSSVVQKILDSDSVVVRFRLSTPPAEKILFRGSDYFSISSCLRVEGIANTDSLVPGRSR